MDNQSQQELYTEYQRHWLDECRGSQFVLKTFASYPSLRSIDTAAWDEEHTYDLVVPYIGQAYDPEVFAVVEEGWDHEHCHVCHARISPGDEYWQSVGEKRMELCLACYLWGTGVGS